jgi:hypothetical protein
VYWPAWGNGPDAISLMSEENPYELLDRLDVQPGQFDMFISYGRQDESHVDNQVDSFLHKATTRGLDVWVRFDPNGHHTSQFVNDSMPAILEALGERLWLAEQSLAVSKPAAHRRKSQPRIENLPHRLGN